MVHLGVLHLVRMEGGPYLGDVPGTNHGQFCNPSGASFDDKITCI